MVVEVKDSMHAVEEQRKHEEGWLQFVQGCLSNKYKSADPGPIVWSAYLASRTD
jgi:hypothetical protein